MRHAERQTTSPSGRGPSLVKLLEHESKPSRRDSIESWEANFLCPKSGAHYPLPLNKDGALPFDFKSSIKGRRPGGLVVKCLRPPRTKARNIGQHRVPGQTGARDQHCQKTGAELRASKKAAKRRAVQVTTLPRIISRLYSNGTALTITLPTSSAASSKKGKSPSIQTFESAGRRRTPPFRCQDVLFPSPAHPADLLVPIPGPSLWRPVLASWQNRDRRGRLRARAPISPSGRPGRWVPESSRIRVRHRGQAGRTEL
ncbi:hypothetical protein F5X68DRAFT_30520 [Plectosphaerella plurivora]|uniref:Uncharacterized protein n=1 Tax=Plectosphaerella plurivora TaxID=936078 RepID=A0A9P8VLR2_9PEZI|nr:hypothetical protein F5X68DRAFT_30520 [Plectosphaerella plurivora]